MVSKSVGSLGASADGCNGGALRTCSRVSTMLAALNGGRFGYGALSGAQSPRRVQIAIKINF